MIDVIWRSPDGSTNQWPFQDPIDWRYHLCSAYLSDLPLNRGLMNVLHRWADGSPDYTSSCQGPALVAELGVGLQASIEGRAEVTFGSSMNSYR